MSDHTPSWFQEQMTAVDQEIAAAQEKKKLLTELLNSWRVHSVAQKARARPRRPKPDNWPINGIDRIRGATPADAIDVLVEENPGRFRRRELASTLQNLVESEAANPRVVIQNAIRRKEGTVIWTDPATGRVWPMGHSHMKAKQADKASDSSAEAIDKEEAPPPS